MLLNKQESCMKGNTLIHTVKLQTWFIHLCLKFTPDTESRLSYTNVTIV